MELIFVVLILFAKKQHKVGFSHFDEAKQKTVFFYNPWPDAQIFVDGYFSGICGSGFLNFPMMRKNISVEIIAKGHVVFHQDYKLFDNFIMIFLPQSKRPQLKRVLP